MHSFTPMQRSPSGQWFFDIPDPSWSRAASRTLCFQTRLIVDGHELTRSELQRELIDSLILEPKRGKEREQ